MIRLSSIALVLLAASAARAQTPINEANEAADAIQTIYAFTGEVSDAPQWMETPCFRKLTGYGKVLACAQRVATAEHARATKLRPHSWTGSCARQIDGAVRAMLLARAAYVDAWVQWLKVNAAELTKTLASKPIIDACSGAKLFEQKHTPACDAQPSEDAFSAKEMSSVNDIACTKTLFRCGRDLGNVCWIQKAASLLDRKPQGPDDYLYVRATGERVTP
jgi:hypothetical protein